jgi:hypothetical protein
MARSDGWDNVRKFGKTVRKTETILKFLSGRFTGVRALHPALHYPPTEVRAFIEFALEAVVPRGLGVMEPAGSNPRSACTIHPGNRLSLRQPQDPVHAVYAKSTKPAKRVSSRTAELNSGSREATIRARPLKARP